MDYTLFILTHGNSTFPEQIKNSLEGFPIIIFKGDGYNCYSKIINDIIVSCKTEIVIIINHKLRPSVFDIYKMLHLIHKGYGLVSMRNFYFFGFKKDLIRKIGFFDERFNAGNEDSDFVRRVINNNIAWYDSIETPLIIMKTSWGDQSQSRDFFLTKWKDGKMERLIEDEKYNYDIGEYQGAKFLTLEHTVLSKTNEDYFNSINFKFK